MKYLTLVLILVGSALLLSFKGEVPTYASGSLTLNIIGSEEPVLNEIYYEGMEESYEDYLFRNCNENPDQYDFWKNKIVLDTKLCIDNGICSLKEWNLFGTSMRPTIISGDNVIIKSDISYNLKKGMVVLYDARDEKESPLNMEIAKKYEFNIIHRIVEVSKEGYVIKGDNNDICEYISKDSIKGVVVELIK